MSAADLVTALRVELEGLHHDPVQLPGDRGVDPGGGRNGRRQQLAHPRDVVLGLKQAPPRQHLVKHDAQREDVGAAVEGANVNLFRATGS